jgi:hypothetical protein
MLGRGSPEAAAPRRSVCALLTGGRHVGLKEVDDFARQRHAGGDVGGVRALRALPLDEIGGQIRVDEREDARVVARLGCSRSGSAAPACG